MSSSPSSTSLPPFSEYNNSKYGFKIQYPSDWKVNSTANDSLSSPPITGASTDAVASIASSSDLQRGRQGLVTISVENLSEGASQQANGNLTAYENLTAYDYAPIVKQLSLTLGSATERGQTNLVRNESLNIGSETSGKNNKNLSAWRIDSIASDYKSDVFVINGTQVFDIGFSAPKESATQSLPIFDKMLNSFQFTVTTPNVTANEDTLSTTDITNASVTSNQSTIPLNEIVQQKPLSQLPSSLIPLSSQQQQEPSTFQTEQQEPLPPPSNISQQQPPSNISQQQPPSNISQQQPPSNISQQQPPSNISQQQPPSNISQQQPPSNISQQLQQQQQQPLLGQVMQQQQPVFRPPLAQQQQLSSIQQQPTAQAPSTIQQLPTQLMQTSSSTPSSSSTLSPDSTSPPPPSTPNQATTTTSSTGTPSTTTQQSSGPAPAPTPPPTTSPLPAAQQQLSSIYQQPAAPQPQSTIQRYLHNH